MVAEQNTLVTAFAPPERAPLAVVQQQAASLSTSPTTRDLLNSVLNFVLILNAQRQIVFASQNLAALLPNCKLDELIGMRPGEALGCTHAHEMEAGCGTSKFCSECGAVKAILSAAAGQSDMQECRLTRIVNGTLEALDLLVYASPFTHGQEQFTLFCVNDISHQKRRLSLERIFFHDILNTVGGMEGLIQLLRSEAPATMQSELTMVETACQVLLEQVQSQKDLTNAENNELQIAPVPLFSHEILAQVRDVLSHHVNSKTRQIVIQPDHRNCAMISDGTLLRRVLGNLVKNAVEASPTGGIITLDCTSQNDQIRFSVHNQGCMPAHVQLQIFQRSFSTKGMGHGLGTYSVKLLTERYLKGRVSFTSTPEAGTTFFVTLPKRLEG